MAINIDLFDLRTITVGSKPPVRISAFCYKGLAAFRFDTFAPNISQGNEIWTITILRDDTLFPCIPVFKNLDAVAGFIFDVSTLLDWTQPLTSSKLRAALGPLSQMLAHYKAYPLELVVDECLPESERERLSIPLAP